MWNERSGLAIALILSLLVNALLAGILGGVVLGRGKGETWRERGVVSRASVRALSRQDRQSFMQSVAPYRDAVHEAWQKHRSARTQAEADIAAPVFDRAKVEADFARLRQAAAQVQESNHAGLVQALGGLSASARAALIARDTTAR